MDPTKSITDSMEDKKKLLTQIDNHIEYITEHKTDNDTFSFYDTSTTSYDTSATSVIVKYDNILDNIDDYIEKINNIRSSMYNKQNNLSILKNIVDPENVELTSITDTSKEIKADISQTKNSAFILYTINKEEVLALLLYLKNTIDKHPAKDTNITINNTIINTEFLIKQGYFDDDDKDYVGRAMELTELSNNTVNTLDELNKELLSMYNIAVSELYDRIDSILANLLVKNIL